MTTIRWTSRGDNGRVSVTREWLDGRISLFHHIPGLRIWSLEFQRPGGFYHCNFRRFELFPGERMKRWYLCLRLGKWCVAFTDRPNEKRWNTVTILCRH